MERLTKTYSDGTHGASDSLPCGENSYDYKNLLIEKLGKYEDLEEQGRLIKLPCKVGDTVYVIHYIDRHYVICSHVISKFVIMPYRFPRVQIYFEKENGFISSDFEGQVNENLFLTRVEADAKLKELRCNND